MNEKKIDPKTMLALEELKAVPARDPALAERARVSFLKEAAFLRPSASRGAARNQGRLINRLFPAFSLRSPWPAFNAILAVFLALVIFLGGGAVTVAAAQESLPDQTLYTVKTWSEDALVTLAPSPKLKLQYNLDFSDRRISEITNLLSSGKPIPEKVESRLQAELKVMLELAASLEDTDMRLQLEQMHRRAEAQLQRLDALVTGASIQTSPVLAQVQEQVSDQIRWCALGLADPQGFKLQLRLRWRNQGGVGGQALTPASTPLGPAGNQRTGGNGQSTGAGNSPQGSGMNVPTTTPTPVGTQTPCSGCGIPIVTPNGPGGGQPASTPNGPGPGSYQPTITSGANGPGTGENQPTSMPGSDGHS
jgi:hypothetical protein